MVNMSITYQHLVVNESQEGKLISKDIGSYQKLMLEKVSDIKQVDNMQSMVVLSTFKDSKVIPVN